MAPKGPAASPKLPPSAPPTSLPVPGSREAMAECSTRPPRVPCEKGAKPQRAQGETHVLPTSCCPCPEDRGAFLQNKRLPCQGSGHGTGLDRLILQQRQLYVPPEQLPTRPHSRALSRAVFLPPRQSAGPAGHQAAKPLRSTLPQRPSGDWGRLEVRCRPRGSTSRSGSAQSQTCLTGGDQAPAGSPRRPSCHGLPLPPALLCRSSERGWSRQVLLQALAKGAGAAACGHQRARAVPLEERRETKETLTEGSGN